MQPLPTLLATLLLLPLVFLGRPQLVRSVSNSVDESGTCHCVVHLPNNSVLLQHLEQLQSMAKELISKYQELFRASEYAHAIKDQETQAVEISHTQETRNSRAITSLYETPAFDLLLLQLEGAQKKLATQLETREGVSVAADLLYQLQDQVTNASLTLKLLADSNQRSFGALQQEADVLQGQLNECEREKDQEQASRHPGPPLLPGSCSHRGLQKVSRPLVLKLNWKGLPHKAGAWGRDAAPGSDSSLYWVVPLQANGRYFDYYQLYKSYNDLVMEKNYKQWWMGYGDGSGNTVYKNFMYFNSYGTSDMAMVDLSSNTLVRQRPLPGATYNNRFSYAGVPWKDLDFAVDEKGLWVLYATEESKGNLVVSHLNASTLEVEKSWHTSQYKPALSGAFMACGVLYALRSLSTRQEEIFYAFDTTNGLERHLSIHLDKMLDTLYGINYCPLDHKLYVYNDGYLVHYDLTFLTQKHTLPRRAVKRSSGDRAPLKPVKSSEPSRS